MKFKIKPEHVVIGTLAVSAPRYMAAFAVSDAGELSGFLSGLTTVLIGISGIGLGLIEVAGTSAMIDGWKRKSIGSKPWKILTVFLALTGLLSLAILVPFTVARLQGQNITDLLGGFSWPWALAVNFDPFVILVGVSYCQRETNEKPVSRTKSNEKQTKPPVKFRYECEHCDFATDNQRALAGHMRKHNGKDASK